MYGPRPGSTAWRRNENFRLSYLQNEEKRRDYENSLKPPPIPWSEQWPIYLGIFLMAMTVIFWRLIVFILVLFIIWTTLVFLYGYFFNTKSESPDQSNATDPAN